MPRSGQATSSSARRGWDGTRVRICRRSNSNVPLACWVQKMRGQSKIVKSIEELVVATNDRDVRLIIVAADLDDIPSIRLLPHQNLRSSYEQRATLTFRENTDGLQLSSDNTVSALDLVTSPERRAIWNDCGVDDLGRISLHALQTVGRVQIVAKSNVRRGHVEADGLDIVSADARSEQERPHANGIHVLQGAFTLWNMQTGEDVVLTDLVNLSVGRLGLLSLEAASSSAVAAIAADILTSGDWKQRPSMWCRFRRRRSGFRSDRRRRFRGLWRMHRYGNQPRISRHLWRE